MTVWQAADRASEPFHRLLLAGRGRTGLTQRQLADRAGVSARSIQDWEAGVSYPSAERLQQLIAALLEAGGLSAGRETEEARALWAAVESASLRMHAPFDAVWFAHLLAERPLSAAGLGGTGAGRGAVPAGRAVASVAAERHQDWGEAPDVLGFVNRTDELGALRRWILDEGRRVVALVGIGGVGKTSLAAKLAQEVAPGFERVYWRSLRDAPTVGDWLAGAIGFLSDQRLAPPASESERLTLLLRLLRDRPCLLMLDNFETLFEPGQDEGRYRAGLAGYGHLLGMVGEAAHRSCLLLTSREAPVELAILGGDAVRTLQLGGLGVDEARSLLGDKRLIGDAAAWVDLVARCAGNGLALRLVGESIHQIFGGEIDAFLKEAGAGVVFGGIRRLLAEQVERSSALEQRILRALAVERDPLRLTVLLAALGPGVGRGSVVEAVEALRRRSLVERAEAAGSAAFTLQSVVLEFVSDQLVEAVTEEIERGRPTLLVEQPLVQAQAREYVRQSQERLIGAPILQLLTANHGDTETEWLLRALLDGWRYRPPAEQGYGPGNVVNLLRLLRGDLRESDLRGLTLRQAYLAEVDAQDASLVNAHLAETVLAEAFHFPASVALSGDGALLAAGTTTGEVWLWRVADRTPLWAVQGHTGAIWAVAQSGDGRLVASGGEDGTVRVWATATGRPVATLQGNTGAIRGVALSADGRLVAGGGADGTVGLWETATGRPLATLEGHSGWVRVAALSADGHLVASGGEDGAVRLWETATGRPLATLEGHSGAVWGVALSADGQLVASGGADGTVRLWEAETGRPLATLQGHTSWVWGVSLAADGRLVASGGEDGTVRLWETATGRPLAILPGHTGMVRGVALALDGRLVASGGEDGTVRLWETATGRPLATLPGHTDAVWGVAVSADGKLLASGGFDGAVRLWEAETGRPVATLPGHTGAIRGVALTADGRLVASSGADGTVRLWEAETGRPLATLAGHSGWVRGAALSADGRLVASSGGDGTVRLWEVDTGRPLATLEGHGGAIWGVALTADGRLVAGGGDGTVQVWETATGRLLATLEGHSGAVRGVAFSADGRLLAGGGGDGTIRLWETSTGRPVAALEGHRGAVWGAALSADGRLLASSGGDGTVRLWETDTGRPLATLVGHSGVVWSVALSADGRRLASASVDGTVRQWEASTGTCVRTLRAERRYERLDITGLSGITDAQRQALIALGAVDQNARATPT
jgi:WD40 repeat protein/transcriptional regulator with XRE-family HTH domain